MLDIQSRRNHAATTWRDFFTTSIPTWALIFANSLEQTVEATHISTKRHQLEKKSCATKLRGNSRG